MYCIFIIHLEYYHASSALYRYKADDAAAAVASMYRATVHICNSQIPRIAVVTAASL